MARVTGSIVIGRSIEGVFDAVANQTNEPRYNPSMTASRQVTDGPIGVGTHFLATILIRGDPRRSTSRSPATSAPVSWARAA